MSRRSIEVADSNRFTGPTIDVVWTFKWVEMTGTVYSGKFSSIRSKSAQRGETLARQRLGRYIPKDKHEYNLWEQEVFEPMKRAIIQNLFKEFGESVLSCQPINGSRQNVDFELTWADREALLEEQHKNKLRFDHAGGKRNWYHTDMVSNGRGTLVRWCWMKHKNTAGFFLTWRETCPKKSDVWTRDQNSIKARRAKKAAKAFAYSQFSRAWKKQEARKDAKKPAVVEKPQADPLAKAREAKAKKREQHARRCEILKKARQAKAGKR